MGVMGSYCQLCRLPLQHDHYVPDPDGGGGLAIYRGRDPKGAPAMRLTRDHEWLADAVALPWVAGRPLAGAVEDGVLVDATSGTKLLVMAGDEDGLALHRRCWEMLGSPAAAGDAAPLVGRGTHGAAQIEPYLGQLFELADFVAHGAAWMLDDPRAAPKSRERIDAIRAQARANRLPVPRPARVADVIAADRDWDGMMLRDGDGAATHIVRYRTSLRPDLDLATYPALVWAIRDYDGSGLPDADGSARMRALEHAIKDAAELGERAILLVVTVGEGKAQFLLHARDEAATRAAIDKLGKGAEVAYDNADEPTWRTYFTQMNPNVRR